MHSQSIGNASFLQIQPAKSQLFWPCTIGNMGSLNLCKIPFIMPILPIISKNTTNGKTVSPKAVSTVGKDKEVKELKGFLATANVNWTYTLVVLYLI